MQINDPDSGETCFRQRRRRRNEPKQARHLNFSCFHHHQFLSRNRTRHWFIDALAQARSKWPVDLWAYVIMPEHVHLLVLPRGDDGAISGFLRELKADVGRKAVAHLKEESPEWLARITVREGDRLRHRFWQPGGGNDRNIVDFMKLRFVIDYIHANPVRRGLVKRALDWEWSSARWYARLEPVPIEMDRTLPEIPDRVG
jgi:putative transposase